MKKIFGILMILFLVISFVACGKKDLSQQEENNSNEVETTENIEKTIVKYFDENMLENYSKKQVIKLPENAATGYEWVYVIEDSEVVNMVKDEYQAIQNSEEIVGDMGYRVCEIEGVSEGDTIIYFEYIRGLEENEIPAERVKFNVSVNSNNEVAIMSEIH